MSNIPSKFHTEKVRKIWSNKKRAEKSRENCFIHFFFLEPNFTQNRCALRLFIAMQHTQNSGSYEECKASKWKFSSSTQPLTCCFNDHFLYFVPPRRRTDFFFFHAIFKYCSSDRFHFCCGCCCCCEFIYMLNRNSRIIFLTAFLHIYTPPDWWGAENIKRQPQNVQLWEWKLIFCVGRRMRYF